MWVETFQEFCVTHGKPVRLGQQFYFPDGAYAVEELRGYRMFDPSPVAKERLNMQRKYCVERCCRVKAAFTKLQRALTGAVDEVSRMTTRFVWDDRVTEEFGPPPPGRDGLVALKRLQTIADERRAALAAVEAEYSKLPEVIAARAAAAEAEQWVPAGPTPEEIAAQAKAVKCPL